MIKNNKSEIIARFRKEIEKSGMPLNELAEKTNIPIGTLRKYMRKEVLPSVKNLFKVCCVFNISADVVLGYRKK